MMNYAHVLDEIHPRLLNHSSCLSNGRMEKRLGMDEFTEPHTLVPMTPHTRYLLLFCFLKV